MPNMFGFVTGFFDGEDRPHFTSPVSVQLNCAPPRPRNRLMQKKNRVVPRARET